MPVHLDLQLIDIFQLEGNESLSFRVNKVVNKYREKGKIYVENRFFVTNNLVVWPL